VFRLVFDVFKPKKISKLFLAFNSIQVTVATTLVSDDTILD